MDKPRHPLVIRPWKTHQTQRTKWNVPPAKMEKERWRLDLKKPKTIASRKTCAQGSKKTF